MTVGRASIDAISRDFQMQKIVTNEGGKKNVLALHSSLIFFRVVHENILCANAKTELQWESFQNLIGKKSHKEKSFHV